MHHFEHNSKKSLTEVWQDTELFFSRTSSQQANFPIVPRQGFDVHRSFQSVSPNTLKPTTGSQSHSVNFKTATVLPQAQVKVPQLLQGCNVSEI
jgi:hypothetical protein